MVANERLGSGIEVHITVNTAHVPHVLPFEIRTVAPANHRHTYVVRLAHLRIGSNVKLCRIVRPFRITHVFAIYINECRTVDTVKVKEDVLFVPLCRERKVATVMPHRVVQSILHLNVGRIVLEGIIHINI